MLWLISLLFLCLQPFAAIALTVDETLTDPVMEASAQQLFREVRCVVCVSESIADSNASVAADMRKSIRSQISQGISGEQIKSGLAAQYGDGILMRPPLKESTWMLWFGPWLILGIGAIAIFFYFRSQRQQKS